MTAQEKAAQQATIHAIGEFSKATMLATEAAKRACQEMECVAKIAEKFLSLHSSESIPYTQPIEPDPRKR